MEAWAFHIYLSALSMAEYSINALIHKIFPDQVPVFVINIFIKSDFSAFSFAGKVADVQRELMKSADHMFFPSGDIGFQRVGWISEAVVPYQEICKFIPFLYPDAPMTDGPVRSTEHPANIGIVHIDAVFVPKIELYNSQ